MTAYDEQDAHRISAQKNAEHKARIEAIAERNRQAHLVAKKRQEAARLLSERLRRGLGGE